MKRSILEDSLYAMLKRAHVTELPDGIDPNKVWAKAIVKVERKTGQCDYTLAIHDFFSDGEVRIVKEMGDVGAFNKVLSIHPYMYLNEGWMPNVKTRQDIIRFVLSQSDFKESYLEGLSKEELKKYFMQECINVTVKNVERLYSIKSYQLGDFEPTKEEEPIKEKDENETTESTESGDAGDAGSAEPKTETKSKPGRKPKVEPGEDQEDF